MHYNNYGKCVRVNRAAYHYQGTVNSFWECYLNVQINMDINKYQYYNLNYSAGIIYLFIYLFTYLFNDSLKTFLLMVILEKHIVG